MPAMGVCGTKGAQGGEAFSEVLHGPSVVLVAEGAEKAMPKGSVPAMAAGETSEGFGLGFQTNKRGLAEKVVL